MDYLNQLISVFFGFFAIMNPIANTAVFIGLTAGVEQTARVALARKSLLITLAVVVVFALLGKTIFHFFGISLPALRITGGILVFIIGYQMLHGDNSSMHSSDNQQNLDDLAVSPLAVPILAGPGTIATAMSFAAGDGYFPILSTIITFALLCVITYVCFCAGEKIINKLGDNLIKVITRLMGLILAVIGTQMFLEGAEQAIAAFKP
ncbi:MarC family protein [Ferrimonas senticii]|uniref:MarC family protein n=1 Tax=Ferrimonas senticii TaxID=394566 RepID=UPI000429267E|nr:MarC family protein [Ferrimonas senticii]